MCKATPLHIRGNDCIAIRQMSEFVKDHIHNKKAGPSDCVPLFDTTYKKSGTAILLFRILRLWYCLCNKQQHRSPRRTYII